MLRFPNLKVSFCWPNGPANLDAEPELLAAMKGIEVDGQLHVLVRSHKISLALK